MAIENFKEIGKYLEENKDKKDVQALVKGLQKDPFENIKTKEDAAKYILGNDLLKQAQESYKDVGVTGGIKTYKENNFDKDYQERYDKEHPPEDKRDKRIRDLEIKDIKREAATARKERKILAWDMGIELKLSKKAMDKKILDCFITDDDETTRQNVRNYAEALNEISLETKNEISIKYGITPEQEDKPDETGNFTREQIENWSPEEQRAAEIADKVKFDRSIQAIQA